MDIFALLTLLGGLTFFLFGMHVMSGSLEKMAGGSLERMLKKVTANPFVSLLLGAAITIAMQSSSATTVMLVGLVNSGIMEFSQTLNVIFGANIGTTLTAWILSLSGIQSSNVWVQMLKPINFSPIVAFFGIVLLMFAKSDRKRSVGTVFIGFALLMYGMTMMSDSVSPLAEMPQFSNLLIQFNNPLFGILLAVLFTAIIQSSAASIGILQALSLTGSLTYGMVIPMVMGLNIGTCATSLISCIGANVNARRVAGVHVAIKVIGALICLPLFLLLDWFFDFAFVEEAVTPVGIALIHTVYNLILTLLLMPFSRLLVRLISLIVRDRKSVQAAEDDPEPVFQLDERLLRAPSVAISESSNATVRMCTLARDTLLSTISILYHYDEKAAAKILRQEDKLDLFEDKLGTFLVPLAAQSLSRESGKSISMMLHTIGDFERLGDHAVNLLKVSKEIHDKNITFSAQATAELEVLTKATLDILDITERAYREKNETLAQRVEPLEQVIDKLIAQIKDNHISRLCAGDCTIELGFVLSDLLTNYERISDHCSNIAVAVIELNKNSFETHQYLNGIKYGNVNFDSIFSEYDQKYALG